MKKSDILNVPELLSGFVLLPSSVDLLVKRHGEGHAQKLYDQHTHSDGSQKVFVVVQPVFYLFIATPCPEGVGGVASTARIKLLATAVWNHVFMQGEVPVIVILHAAAIPLSLDIVPCITQPSVVISVVQDEAFGQVLFGVLTHLVGVDKEEDQENEFSQEDDQQNDEEAQQQTLVLLDGTQAAQETRHHDDRAQRDDEVGGGERGEGGREGGEAALGDREPHANAQQPTATQPEEQVEEEEHVLHTADAAASHD